MYSQGVYAPLFPHALDPADRPFARMPYQGYEIFRAADRGGWWRLVQPGATGWGLAALLVLDANECIHGDGRIPAVEWTIHRPDGTPWLLPALVRWSSCTGDDRLARADLAEAYADATVPMVEISEFTSLSQRPLEVNGLWPRRSGQNEAAAVGMADSRYVVGPSYGGDMAPLLEALERSVDHESNPLLPIWQVVPVDDAAVGVLRQALWALEADHALELIDACACEVNDVYGDEVCERQAEAYWSGSDGVDLTGHTWPTDPLGSRHCECGDHAVPHLITEHLLGRTDDWGALLPSPYDRAWAHLTSTYSDGWRVVDDAARERKSWATSWQQLFCPWPDSPGHAPTAEPPRSAPSTTSGSRLAS